MISLYDLIVVGVFCLTFLPAAVYLTVKAGTYGYLRGVYQFYHDIEEAYDGEQKVGEATQAGSGRRQAGGGAFFGSESDESRRS